MNRRNVFAAVLSLMLCGQVRADQPTYEFKQDYRDGQQFNVLFSQNMDVSCRASYRGRYITTYRIVDAMQEKGLLTIVQTNGGSPVAERIDFDPAGGHFSQRTGEPPKQEYTKFAGKTVIVRRDHNGFVTCEVNGDEDPHLARSLKHWLERDEEIYPDHPVRVNEKWDLTAKLMQTVHIADDQQGLAFGRLLAVKTIKGRQFAQLLTSIGMVGNDRSNKSLHLEIQMEGTAWVDLATGRIAKLDLAGDVRTTGTIPVPLRNGQVVSVDANGSGKVEYHQLCIAAKTHKSAVAEIER